jgi:plastocyanin
MRITLPAWLLGLAAVAFGIALGAYLALSQGMIVSARSRLAPPRELPQVRVAPGDRPAVAIGAIVRMTPYGYLPQTAEVRAGEAVEFVNAATAAQRPMSDPHPGHGYDPLDAPGVVDPGRSWFAVMERPGAYRYHDEIYPNVTGVVIVR